MSASPAAKSRAASMTRCCRASRASGVRWPAAADQHVPLCGGGVGEPRHRRVVGQAAGGDEQHLLVQVGEVAPMASPSSRIRSIGVNGGATELMKTGMNGLAVMSP